MQVLQEGTEYLADTSDRDGQAQGRTKPYHIKFCHKTSDGNFVHGLTSEELTRILIHRQRCMVTKKGSEDNIQTLLHLQQALDSMTRRNFKKLTKQRSPNEGS